MQALLRYLCFVSCCVLPVSNLCAVSLSEEESLIEDYSRIAHGCEALSNSPCLLTYIIETKGRLEEKFGVEISWDEIFMEMEKHFIENGIDLKVLDKFKTSVKKRLLKTQAKHLGELYDEFSDLPPGTRAGLGEVALGSGIMIGGAVVGSPAAGAVGAGLIIDGARRICDDYERYSE